METHRLITIISWLIIIFFVYLVLGLQIFNGQQKLAWGIKIANLNLGGKTTQVAQEILENKWKNFASQEISLFYQTAEKKYTWSVRLMNLGFRIDFQPALKAASQIGRQGNFLIQIKEQLTAFLGLYNFKPAHQTDKGQFQNYTAELFKNIERPAQNATLLFSEGKNDFELKPAQAGWVINRQKILDSLCDCIDKFSSQPIVLEIINDFPLVEDKETELARQKANETLNNLPYQLVYEKKSWPIDKEFLLNWLVFQPAQETDSDNIVLGLFLNQGKITEYLNKLAKEIDQPTINAKLETESNRATIFAPGQKGQKLELEKTYQAIMTNILSQPPVKKTELVVEETQPKITLNKTNQLGINGLLASGVSNFAGSPANRISNIKLGASKFNSLILMPDEEFSFNAILGEVGPDQGYLRELVIKKDVVIPEYGGGLCQVSTTLFRAAVNSGLKITERANHSFPVVYYNPQGFDATIYDPHPDLRFINDTPNHLLIEAVVKGNQLTFNFYGTADGRKTKIIGPTTLWQKEDGSMKTVLTQEIYRDGALAEKKVFYSNYKSPDLYASGHESPAPVETPTP